MPIGPWEIVLLVLIVVLIFGSRRLPEIGRGLGKGMREFKDSLTGKDEKGGAEPTELTAAAVEEDEEPVAGASGDGRERDTASSSS